MLHLFIVSLFVFHDFITKLNCEIFDDENRLDKSHLIIVARILSSHFFDVNGSLLHNHDQPFLHSYMISFDYVLICCPCSALWFFHT